MNNKQFLYFCPSSWLYLLPCIALEFVFIFEERSISTLHLRPFFARNELGVSVLVSKFFNVSTPLGICNWICICISRAFQLHPPPGPLFAKSDASYLQSARNELTIDEIQFLYSCLSKRKRKNITTQKWEYTPEQWRKTPEKYERSTWSSNRGSRTAWLHLCAEFHFYESPKSPPMFRQRDLFQKKEIIFLHYSSQWVMKPGWITAFWLCLLRHLSCLCICTCMICKICIICIIA